MHRARLFLWKEINKTLLSVTKFVAYQKYVHIKGCVARRYVPRGWGQVKMIFIPVSRKANYNEAKGYPISLCPSRRKQSKNW